MQVLYNFQDKRIKHYRMKNMRYIQHLAVFCMTAWGIIALFAACNADKQAKTEENVRQLLPDAPAEVTVIPLKTVDFEHELVSNGKISARTVAEVKFQTSEIIADVFVANGDRVTKGQRIAALETYALNNKLEQAKDALERSKLEMHDVLIGQGYKLDNLSAVPDEVMRLAKIKSGFNNAQTNYSMADYDLKQATLVAPVNGIVANLFAKPKTLSKPSEVFCNIIDTQSLEVVFTVLENELGFVRKGDNVKVVPYSMPDIEIKGRVSEINPWVNENGMVQIKATVSYHPQLVEGMNVRVSAFRSVGKQWVVPKTAVVLRTGKQVVFTVVDGKAVWNYVQTGLENATEYTVTGETLKEGDPVIVTGNINLAHESPVKVIQDEKNKE